MSDETQQPLSDEEIIDDMLEYDPVVQMPPRKEYKIRLHIVSIECAKPNILDPEEI